MVVLRCTQQLLRRLPSVRHLNGSSTTRLGDWCGGIFNVGRISVVLFISEKSRLPVVLPAKDFANLATRLVDGLENVLISLRVPLDVIQRELGEMRDAQFAPTNNRSLLGTLNDFRNQLEWLLAEHPGAGSLDLSLALAEVPVGPLDYRHPASVAHYFLKGNDQTGQV
jgi:hypothetical protein